MFVYTHLIDKIRERISSRYPLIQVLLGPRQVGKTTAAQSLFKEFAGPKLFVTADGPSPPDHEWLRVQWLKARGLGNSCLLIVDEVQKVSGWSEVAKELFDQDRDRFDIRVLFLGSSSLMLQKGLSESLAGRFELVRAYHWNFGDTKKIFSWSLDQYLQFGGYPGAARYSADPERWVSYVRDSIIEPVIGRDILSSAPVTKPALLRQTFELTMNYPAQELSYQKIVGQLQDRGSVATIKNYLHLLEGAFLLRQVFQYATRPLTTRTSSPKIIPLAPALSHAFVNPKRVLVDNEWRGRVFESVVGAALAQLNVKLFTWREGNAEVDFVLEIDGALLAIEVKSGRKRSASGLGKFQRKYPHAKLIIITESNALPLLEGGGLDSLP